MQSGLLRRVWSLGLTVSLLGARAAYGDFIVVPNAQTTSEGNAFNLIPFSMGTGGQPTTRYQQVYASAQFGGELGIITQITFRPDAGVGAPFTGTISNAQINFSTTTRAPDALSTTFASNVGVDDMVVYGRSLTLFSAFTGPPGGPKDFDILIDLQAPFFYDPSAGNLLLDIRLFSRLTPTQFLDTQNTTGDLTSRLRSNDGVDSPTGIADTLGLVTRFTVTTVPEPSTLLLTGLGALVLLYDPRSRRTIRSTEVRHVVALN